MIISTIGASIFLSNTTLALYGPAAAGAAGLVRTQGIQLGGVFLDSQYLLIIAVTAVLVAVQYWFFEHTLFGKKLQATSQDKEMASLLGIPVARMIMLTFVYSAVLGGIAGILVAPVLFVSIQMGATIALKAFAATIIGGFGDVTGAIIGGLALGADRDLRGGLYLGALQGCLRLHRPRRVPDPAPAGPVRRTHRGEGLMARRPSTGPACRLARSPTRSSHSAPRPCSAPSRSAATCSTS